MGVVCVVLLLLVVVVLLVVMVHRQQTCAQIRRRGYSRLSPDVSHALHLDMKGDFTLHFDYLRECDKSVDKLLSQNFFDNIFVVIVSEGSTQFVVIHVMLILAETPESGHLFGVDEFEFAIGVGPRDYVFVLKIIRLLALGLTIV
jgi:hypothetical protein